MTHGFISSVERVKEFLWCFYFLKNDTSVSYALRCFSLDQNLWIMCGLNYLHPCLYTTPSFLRMYFSPLAEPDTLRPVLWPVRCRLVCTQVTAEQTETPCQICLVSQAGQPLKESCCPSSFFLRQRVEGLPDKHQRPGWDSEREMPQLTGAKSYYQYQKRRCSDMEVSVVWGGWKESICAPEDGFVICVKSCLGLMWGCCGYLYLNS